jgi:hypothetical protein
MAIVETTQELPLTSTADGTIKISGTRVSLDSVVFNYSITTFSVVFLRP